MSGDIIDIPLFSPLPNTLKFLGPATFLFTIHYCVLSMGAEVLHDKADEDEAEYEEKHHHDDKISTESISTSSSENINQIELVGGHSRIGAPPVLTKPLLVAYILSCLLITLLGAGGFLVYRHSEVVM
jgi:hypothetical protein